MKPCNHSGRARARRLKAEVKRLTRLLTALGAAADAIVLVTLVTLVCPNFFCGEASSWRAL
jgi:hypothetical protein